MKISPSLFEALELYVTIGLVAGVVFMIASTAHACPPSSVKDVQTVLVQKKLLPVGNITGYYGPLTKQAVQKFQCLELGLCAGTEQEGYGVVGPRTLSKLSQSCVVGNGITKNITERVLTAGVATTPIDYKIGANEIYKLTLGRSSNLPVADTERIAVDIASGRRTPGMIIWELMATPEFKNKFTSGKNPLTLSDTEYVTLLYKVFLNRTPDDGGLQAIVATLSSGVYRQEAMRRILLSSESKQKNKSLFDSGVMNIYLAKPAVSSQLIASTSPETSSSTKRLATYFFYWYNYDTNEHIINPNGTDALGNHPVSLTDPKFSYENPAWYKAEINDMITAGIDAIYPDYWGFPHPDNRPNYWSNYIFVPMEKAMQELEQEGKVVPKIGMFYDTTVFKSNPIKQLDLTKVEDQEYLAQGIIDFYSQIKPSRWEEINGKPVVQLYASHYAKNYDQSTLTYVKKRFAEHFNGKVPYIIVNSMTNVLGQEWSKVATTADAEVHWGSHVGGSTITGTFAQVSPGIDDLVVGRPVRTYVDRRNGDLYKEGWETVLADKKISYIFTETWNELHESRGIARSKEFGTKYMTITKKYASLWKTGKLVIPNSKETFVDHLYTCVLDREADVNGRREWVDVVTRATSTFRKLYSDFFSSKEYLKSASTDDEFVNQLYQCILFRQPDLNGKAHWLQSLATGEMNRFQLVNTFMKSKEFNTLVKPTLSKNTGIEQK